MKKKILQISKYYHPSSGGTERVCQYLSEGISSKYDVKVICFGESKKKKIEVINGVTVYKSGLFANIFRQPVSFSYFKILYGIIKNWKPDLVHFHLPNPLVTIFLLPILSKQAKLYLHWHQDIVAQTCIYPLFRPLEKRLLRRADMIVTTSLNYKLSSIPLQDFLHKVEVLPNAIDISKLTLTGQDIYEVENIRKSTGEKKIILFVGRHVLHKVFIY